jgi:hypothetical protein
MVAALFGTSGEATRDLAYTFAAKFSPQNRAGFCPILTGGNLGLAIDWTPLMAFQVD